MDVPPPTIETQYVVAGSAGTSMRLMAAIACPMAYIGLTMPKAPKLCPPGPLKRTE